MIRFFLLIVTFLWAFAPVQAEVLSLKLVPGNSTKHPTAGLMITPELGWHVYAPPPRNEESFGFSPIVDWSRSHNVNLVEVLWPVPEKSLVMDQQAYTYSKPTLVPLKITPHNPGHEIFLALDIEILTCGNICVPIKKTLNLSLIPNGSGDSRVYETILDIEHDYEGMGFITILLIALLGGFILNFMPCVLPVLSLKLIHFSKVKDKHRMSFLTIALGILASFWALAGIAIGLKLSGEAVGWGLHFQNPYFLSFMLVVILIFTANMLGAFEFILPSRLAHFASHPTKISWAKDFSMGIFATLLATPCSAPFVGSSLSFALARNPADIFGVFTALGFGFALPYLAASCLPAKYITLPKPGMWMVWLQRGLGVGLLLTALWLGWVLSSHLPLPLIGAILVCAGGAVLLFRLHRFKGVAWALILVSIVGVPSLRPEAQSFKPLEDFAQGKVCINLWCKFDEKAIPDLVKQGYVVIVDVTADWCVTCALNKRRVFSDPQFTKILAKTAVIGMRADWTKRSPEITSYLKSRNRFGIPFNVVYGPKAPQGIPLPELLSLDEVLKVLKDAGYEG